MNIYTIEYSGASFENWANLGDAWLAGQGLLAGRRRIPEKIPTHRLS